MTPDPLLDVIFTRLRAWLLTIVPGGTEVLQGPLNRVPLPVAGFVLMTLLFQKRLRTNVHEYTDTGNPGPPADQGTKRIEQGTELHIQLDFYGPDAADWAVAVSILFRDPEGCEGMAPELSPLYIDDGKFAPLVTGEAQYQNRVVSTARFQYNPAVTIAQQFADSADVQRVAVDT